MASPGRKYLLTGHPLERVVTDQLQGPLQEADLLNPFQSGFRPSFKTESGLVALMDDYYQEKESLGDF